jgi:hypothetical protein
VGNFLNTGILLILLCIFDVTTVANQKAHPNRLGGVWRTAFGIGLIPIVAIIFYRVVYLRVRFHPLQCRMLSVAHQSSCPGDRILHGAASALA